MLFLYRSLMMYLPRRGPAGEERKVTMWWQPGALKPGVWHMQVGGGKIAVADRDAILLTILVRDFQISPEEHMTIKQNMMAIEQQEGI